MNKTDYYNGFMSQEERIQFLQKHLNPKNEIKHIQKKKQKMKNKGVARQNNI